MAYWIGGTGYWNDPLHWSDTSGGTGAITGSELITTAADRDFSSDTGFWDKGAWTISGNKANCNSSNPVISKAGILTVGKPYRVDVTISNYVSGILLIRTAALNTHYSVGGVSSASSNNTFTFYIIATESGLAFLASGASNLSIDDISLKEITAFPSSTVAAIIDANSGTGTITIATTAASCASFDASGLTTNDITITNATVNFNLYGNLTEPANYSGSLNRLTWNFTGSGFMYQKGTGTITTNGKAVHPWNRWYIDASGITVTNGDDFNFGGAVSIYHTNGTWDTAGFTITTTGNYLVQVGIKTLTLGNSSFNCAIFSNDGQVNTTINSGTSTITCKELYGGAKTYYNVIINVLIDTSYSTIVYVNTFNNLTINGGSNFYRCSIASNQTVNGVLTINGVNATNYRLLIASSVIGTARTITAASVVASNCDFRDITMANAVDLSAITGGSGDCGGNSANITFTTAATQYYKHTSGACTWKDATKWFTDITPRTTAGRVPLPQDSAIFDATSFNQTCTLTIDVPRKGSSDFSAVTYPVTTAIANAVEIYGHLVLGSNITPSGDFTRTLMGRSSYNLNLYSKTIYDLDVNAYGGTYTFQSGFIFRKINIIIGTIYMGSYIYETKVIISVIVWQTVNGIIFSETSTIKLNPASGSANISFYGGAKTYNKVWFSGTHTGYFDITGANTFAELIIDAGRKVRPVNGITQTISKLTAIGTQANPITITSPTAAAHTWALSANAADVQCDWLILSYSVAVANKFYAGNGSVNGGNNSNWVFANKSGGMFNLL